MVETKIMKVFYDANCLPYKDKERQVHYPIVGNSFTGSSGTTEIRFYVDQIGDLDMVWVVNAKLPNGKTGSKVLSSSGNDSDGAFVRLYLDSWYTQVKGDLYISLQGYQGGINYTYDSDLDLYSISGTPTIQATGVIKINIAFSSPFNGVAELTGENYQALLALIADSNAKGFTIVNDIVEEDLSNYGVGHLFYDKESAEVYVKTNTSPYYERYYDFLHDYVPYIGLFISTKNLNDIYTMASEYNGKAFIFQYSGLTNSGYYIGYITSQGNNRGFNFISLFDYTLAFYGNNVANTTTLETIFANNSSYKHTYMDLESDQEITGYKEFSNPITLWEIYYGSNDFHVAIDQDSYTFEDGYGNKITITNEHYTSNFNTTFDGVVDFNDQVIMYDKLTVRADVDILNDLSVSGDLRAVDVYISRDLDLNNGNVLYADNGDLHVVYDGTDATLTDEYNTPATISASVNTTNYVMTIVLKNSHGTTLSTTSVDLPLESIVTSATYYDTYTYGGTTYTKVIVIVLSTTSVPTIVPVGDLVSGLVSTTDLETTLANYYLKTETYSKSEVNTLLSAKANSSDVVAKTFTIAGINLESNISASDLTDALVFATNSDIDALFE